MPYSAGSFSLYATGNPVVTGTTISSSWANNTLSDIATGLSTCVLKDGSQTITANLPMSSFKITGLAAGSTNGDSVRYEQVIGAFLPITGGTLTGNLLFTDATYDIGASGATRPRDLFLSRNAVIGGTINVTGHTTFEGVTSTGATGTGKLVYDGSPTLVTAVLGSSTATTQSAGDNSTKVATTAYADRLAPRLGTPVATTSGTSVTINNAIPSTAKVIQVTFKGVSTNGTDALLLRIGPSGGVATSGYNSSSVSLDTGGANGTSTVGFLITHSNSGRIMNGILTLALENSSSNSWCLSGALNDLTVSAVVILCAGTVSLSGALSQIALTTTGGTNAFNAGEANVIYL